MSVVLTIVLPSFLLGLAYTLARRELALYREAARDGSDLFVYSRGRLVRRLTGVGFLAALGVTFAAMGLAPPASARGANAFLAIILAELGGLLLLPVVDLVETARTARPGQKASPSDTPPSPGRRKPPSPRRGGS